MRDDSLFKMAIRAYFHLLFSIRAYFIHFHVLAFLLDGIDLEGTSLGTNLCHNSWPRA